MSSSNKTTMKDFEIISKIGEGSFGTVYKVRRKIDKGVYVLKQIPLSKMSEKMKKDAINEAQLLSKINNQYVVKYHEAFQTENNSILNIIMEYCEGGDLGSYIKKQNGKQIPENIIWKFFIQCTVALEYLHSYKILHRDVKTINIFLTKNEEVRLGDLGVAKKLTDETNFAHTMVGTPYYLSPEICEEKPYNEKSDVWSLGCVLYELCTQKHPFEATNQAALILKILKAKYNPISSIYSKELKEIVDMCLTRNYKKRPKMSAILNIPHVTQKIQEYKIKYNFSGKGLQANEEKNKDKSDDVPACPQEQTPKLSQNKRIDEQQHANLFLKQKIFEEIPNINFNDINKKENHKTPPSKPQVVQHQHANLNCISENLQNERHVTRIRKGAPQTLSRNAMLAGKHNINKKKDSPINEPQLLLDHVKLIKEDFEKFNFSESSDDRFEANSKENGIFPIIIDAHCTDNVPNQFLLKNELKIESPKALVESTPKKELHVNNTCIGGNQKLENAQNLIKNDSFEGDEYDTGQQIFVIGLEPKSIIDGELHCKVEVKHTPANRYGNEKPRESVGFTDHDVIPVISEELYDSKEENLEVFDVENQYEEEYINNPDESQDNSDHEAYYSENEQYCSDFEETGEECNIDEEAKENKENKNIPLKNRVNGIKKCMENNKKKIDKLENFIQSKENECRCVIGNSKFDEIISILRCKMNIPGSLTKRNEEEIETTLLMMAAENSQLNKVRENVITILELEVEVEQCKIQIEKCKKELLLINNFNE